MLSRDEIRKYLDYYYLEEYLFNKAHYNFHKNHYLTAKEFFAIVMWKRKASAIKIKNKLPKSDSNIIREITGIVYNTKDNKEKLLILKGMHGVGIAIASAILTVCYPDDFTVLDYRVINSLNKPELGISKLPDKKTENYNLQDYHDYLEACKIEAKKYNLTLRDFDRVLWTMDWYEGEKGLKQVVGDLV